MINKRLRPFGTTVFSEMTRLAIEHDAINLAQGFPDFEGPGEIREAAIRALRDGHNQYSRSQGHPELVEAIARAQQRWYGLQYDPMGEVVVFNGATEGIAAALMGVLEPEDEVILFEPFYDSYLGCIALAGATPRILPLRFPQFELDLDALAELFSDRTRLLVLNTPHNPTGKVFDRTELQGIADLCIQHDVIVLADDVYEHITFDGVPHIPMATLPEMRDRTLTLSSSGKTFSYTGWKIGWGTGPRELVAAAQAAHQFFTFCASTPLQIGIAHALNETPESYYGELRAEYENRRDVIVQCLQKCGFEVASPQGTYFVFADYTRAHGHRARNDIEMATYLTREIGVAALPPSSFYKVATEEGSRLLRFCFSKTMDTLEQAATRLEKLT